MVRYRTVQYAYRAIPNAYCAVPLPYLYSFSFSSSYTSSCPYPHPYPTLTTTTIPTLSPPLFLPFPHHYPTPLYPVHYPTPVPSTAYYPNPTPDSVLCSTLSTQIASAFATAARCHASVRCCVCVCANQETLHILPSSRLHEASHTVSHCPACHTIHVMSTMSDNPPGERGFRRGAYSYRVRLVGY